MDCMALYKWIQWLYFHGLGGSATMEYSQCEIDIKYTHTTLYFSYSLYIKHKSIFAIEEKKNKISLVLNLIDIYILDY